ncbi:MAG TPA: DNA-binding response regulator, partial [Puia sp.]|nr:DNA-binding response regulator [Puia sp.]
MIASQLYNTPAPLRRDKRCCPSAKHQILIVMTERIERDELAGHLRNMADVSFAKNDQEAMNALETCPVQLVISGKSDGDRWLCRYIKSNVRYAHIPFVELIPRDSFAIRLQCLESGVDAWLEKPVSRHILLAQIDNLLVNRARVSEHFTWSKGVEASDISPSGRMDEVLWTRLNQVIVQHLSNTALDIDLLARHLYMSRPTLYRKIAEMSNMSPSEVITLIRLNNAAVLLAAPSPPIGDIARMVGFTTRSGFGKAFLKQY